MPVEIREVIIKTEIETNPTAPGGGAITPEERERLAAEIMEQVMRKLEEKQER